MRLKKMNFIFIYVVSVGMMSCVSIGFQDSETKRNDDVKYSEPGRDFKEVKTDSLDHEWRHEKDGATISYLSDCFNKADPSLESIFDEITREIEDVYVVERGKTEYVDREALNTIVEGKVDGVQTRFQLFIFKKNHCTYILTYAGKAEVFGQHQGEFSKFVKGFTPP